MTKETVILKRVEEITKLKVETSDWFHTAYLTELGSILATLTKNKAIIITVRRDDGYIEFAYGIYGDLSKIPQSTSVKL